MPATDERAWVAQYVGRHEFRDINLFDALCRVQEHCPPGWAADALTRNHTSPLSPDPIEVGTLRQEEDTITLYVVRYSIPRPIRG